MRTQEQIIADCEKRFEELRRQAESPEVQRPCAGCRWSDEYRAAWCHHPLVKGFGKEFHMGAGEKDQGKRIPRLCGHEKALWERKPTLAERIVAILEQIFGKVE